MSKRTFILFGLLVVVLAVVIPWLVFDSKGDAQAGAQEVPASLAKGQEIFQINCGNCHALYAAGTDGNYAPDLDELLAPQGAPTGEDAAGAIEGIEGRVLNAVEHGVSSASPGRMPAGILNEEQAKIVAEFVGNTAGKG